jgi:hypothetical protein
MVDLQNIADDRAEMSKISLAPRREFHHKPAPSLGLGYGLVEHRPARAAMQYRVPPNDDQGRAA